MKIIDSHLHLDIIEDDALFDYIRQNLRAIVIWSFCDARPQTFADLAAYFHRQEAFAAACTAKGLPCYRLAGIHPRNIPAAEPATQAKVDKLLAAQLGKVRGIGEIGLEKSTDAEKEILAMQIDFARRYNLKACIHTPRNNKNTMTPATLDIIEKSSIAKDAVLIDHLNSSPLVWTIVNMGYYAGVTISPAKSSLAEVIQMLKENERDLERIMLNSDLAVANPEDYRLYVDSINALPPTYEVVAGQTALNFFGIEL